MGIEWEEGRGGLWWADIGPISLWSAARNGGHEWFVTLNGAHVDGGEARSIEDGRRAAEASARAWVLALAEGLGCDALRREFDALRSEMEMMAHDLPNILVPLQQKVRDRRDASVLVDRLWSLHTGIKAALRREGGANEGRT